MLVYLLSNGSVGEFRGKTCTHMLIERYRPTPVSKFLLMIETIKSRLATSRLNATVEQAAAREPLLNYATFFVTGRWTSFLKLLLSIFTKRNETKQFSCFLSLRVVCILNTRLRYFCVTQRFGEIREKDSLRMSIQLELQLPIFIARNCFVTFLFVIFVFGRCNFTIKVAGRVWAVDFGAEGEMRNCDLKRKALNCEWDSCVSRETCWRGKWTAFHDSCFKFAFVVNRLSYKTDWAIIDA